MERFEGSFADCLQDIEVILICQHRKLLYNDTQYLLALTLTDKAIFGVNSAEDLWQLQIPHGENELIL